MKLLLQVSVPAHQSVERLLFPDVNSPYLCRLVDSVRGRGLEAAEDFAQRPEHGLALLILLFDLRLE